MGYRVVFDSAGLLWQALYHLAQDDSRTIQGRESSSVLHILSGFGFGWMGRQGNAGSSVATTACAWLPWQGGSPPTVIPLDRSRDSMCQFSLGLIARELI